MAVLCGLMFALCALAQGAETSAPDARGQLPTLDTEERFASAVAAAPVLLVFFFRRVDADGGASGERFGAEGVEGGMATVQLAADVASLARSFPGHVAAVDCARLARLCAERRVVSTPAFKLWSEGRFTRYTGSLAAPALAAFLRRKLGSEAAGRGEAPAGAPDGLPPARAASAPRPRSTVGGLTATLLSAYALLSEAAPLLGLTPPLLLAASALGALLCGLLAVCACAPRGQGAAGRRVQRSGHAVSFEGGSGWLVIPGAAADGPGALAELPAVLLLGPAQPADGAARREQRAALERIAVRLGSRGFRALLLDAPSPSASAPQAAAAVAAAARWLSQPPGGGGSPARVGCVGLCEGAALLSATLRSGGCSLCCAVLLELCAHAQPQAAHARQGGSVALLSAALGELGALAAGSGAPVQLHVDLVDGPLGGGSAGAAAGSDREADARAHAAAKLRAMGKGIGEHGAGGAAAQRTCRLFLYGEPPPHDEAAGEAEQPLPAALAEAALHAQGGRSAAALPMLLPMLLQPDGRREADKAYAWMRALAFLSFHLASDCE